MVGIIGFNLNKIEVERSLQVKGKISIKNNVQFTDVQKADFFLGKSKQEALRFTFEYTSTYEPKAGKVLLKGDLVAVDDAEKVKEVVDSWKKNKKVPKEVMVPVLNSILSKCNVQTIILTKEVNLPPPIPMPKVQLKE